MVKGEGPAAQVIIDADPGDECDAAGQIARMVAWLRESIRRRITDVEWAAMLNKPFGKIYVNRHLVLEATIGTTSDHDPGDEDPRVRVRMFIGHDPG